MSPSRFRRSALLSALTALLLGSASLLAQPLPNLEIEDGDQILFLGDSITQSGRYVALFEAYLWFEYPDLHLDIVNLGLGAETASGDSEPTHEYPRPDIHERIDRVLEATQPDVVVICYGMNDGIYHPFSEERFEAYQKGITSLIEKVKKEADQVVLMTPPPFDVVSSRMKNKPIPEGPDAVFTFQTPYEDYDQVLQKYGSWIKLQTEQTKVIVQMQSALNKFIRQQRDADPNFAYGDGVHPPTEGHLAMALALLKAFGEDRSRAEQVLYAMTNVSLFPEDRGSPPTELYKVIMERHNMLSAAYREHVGHTKPQKSKALPLEEAKEKASALEQDIRAVLAQ